MSRAAAVRVASPLAVAACLAGAASAAMAGPAAPDPGATPQPATTVRDPDFGVAARHFGLQREVEMFQWRPRGNGGYERAWSRDALDSSAFAPGHDNPPFPLRNRQWVAAEVSVDGLPLDPAVLSALGRWEAFRPGFSALPGNLAATFQPQGDGLGTAENPMAPEIGDLRIHWRELRLPPLAGRIELRGGRWVLRSRQAVAATEAATATHGAGRARDGEVREGGAHRWLAVGLLFAAALVASLLAWRRRRRVDRGDRD